MRTVRCSKKPHVCYICGKALPIGSSYAYYRPKHRNAFSVCIDCRDNRMQDIYNLIEYKYAEEVANYQDKLAEEMNAVLKRYGYVDHLETRELYEKYNSD